MFKKPKYKNRRTRRAGYWYDSEGEAGLADTLSILERAGEIRDIRTQVSVYLTKARIQYIADFEFFNVKRNETEWAEFKGLETQVWRIKRRLWMHYGPGRLTVWKQGRHGPMIHEVIDASP